VTGPPETPILVRSGVPARARRSRLSAALLTVVAREMFGVPVLFRREAP
jgi:hypothetical protein